MCQRIPEISGNMSLKCMHLTRDYQACLSSHTCISTLLVVPDPLLHISPSDGSRPSPPHFPFRWFQTLMRDKVDRIRKLYRCVTSAPPPLGPLVHHLLGERLPLETKRLCGIPQFDAICMSHYCLSLIPPFTEEVSGYLSQR